MSDESLPLLTDRDVERIVAALRGMAYEPRFRILVMLAAVPESSPVDLTEALPLEGTIVAHHLRHLLEARLIRRRRRGRRVFYALTDEATRRLVGDVLRYGGLAAVTSVPESAGGAASRGPRASTDGVDAPQFRLRTEEVVNSRADGPPIEGANRT